jgi:hypothetical protein
VIGWGNYTFDSVDVCNCFCQNLCQVIQLIANLDGNKTVREFILSNAFDCGSNVKQVGCGNLYEEGDLVDWGKSIIDSLNVAIELLKSLDVEDDSVEAENRLEQFCNCLLSAACAAPAACAPCVGPPNETPVNPLASQASIDLRKQFFAMFIDLVNFLLFDRDCEFGERGECPCPPSAEKYLEQRCRVGTNDGKCVVCSGACKQYRRQDDYKPMLSVFYAVKYAISLVTLDRSGGADYAASVEALYNGLLSDYYNLYKDASGSTLAFYPDCAAPQFCCSTKNAAASCSKNCATSLCEQNPACQLCPVPCLDTRLATFCCGVGTAYDPCNSNTGTARQTVPIYVEVDGGEDGAPGQFRQISLDELEDALGSQTAAFCSNEFNPCVVQPQACASLSCSTECCEYPCSFDGNNGRWSTRFGGGCSFQQP